jgi:hypothetical protein
MSTERRLFAKSSVNVSNWECGERTVVGARGNAAAGLAVDVADILLQAGVCDAARAVGDGTAGVLRSRGGDGEDSQGEDGGDGELHCGWVFGFGGGGGSDLLDREDYKIW